MKNSAFFVSGSKSKAHSALELVFSWLDGDSIEVLRGSRRHAPRF